AGLDLAAEKGLAGMLPTAVLSNARDRTAHLVIAWIDAEVMQSNKAVRRSRPRLPFGQSFSPRGEQRAPLPLTVLALKGQDPGTPSLGGHASALGCDNLVRLIAEIAQHLPANGRIGIQQPVQHVQGRSSVRSSVGRA